MAQEPEIRRIVLQDARAVLTGTEQGAQYQQCVQFMAAYLQDHGIAEGPAWRAAEAVVCDAPQILSGRITDVPQVLAAYRSYRGVTDAGLTAAEAAGVPEGLRAALDAAVAKARQMYEQTPR